MKKSEELVEIQKKIKEKKVLFNTFKKEKEERFSKSSSYSTDIDELYSQVKDIEKKSNLEIINKKLDEKKEEFEKLDKEVKSCEEELSSLEKTDKKDLDEIFESLNDLKKKLDSEKDEVKIKELKNKIFLTKKKFDKNKLILKRRERNVLKKRKERVDMKIKRLYKKIRIISKDKKVIYTKIDSLKKEKEKEFNLFKEKKQEYMKIFKELKEYFKEENQILKKLGFKNTINKTEIVKQKKELEDKLLKKGGVLTSEDLLLFQMK